MGKHLTNEEFELFHVDYGIVKGTKEDFYKLDPRLRKNFSSLVRDREYRIYGWEKIDSKNYLPVSRNRLVPRRFYCPEFGVVEATLRDFYEKYVKEEGGTYVNVSSLSSGVIKTLYNKWVLAENKDKYEELIKPNRKRMAKPVKILELTHPVHGTHKLSRKEFRERFGLDKYSLTSLAIGRVKKSKGWELLK